ncbi:MAG TPA: RecQ family ATP-dependent DNA helicase [Solirubrobacteraceae bacterium]|nr:RecQ family ATP-dependent DNA helicase [Solirubrobacteraceae bacterium]
MDPGDALRRLFGFEQFRPGQAEAVTAALSGRDALVVMPTGSGKSLCYQLPALMRDDLTLVVSPLVSLMQDQVSAVRAVAPGRVELINAQQGGAANAEALSRVAAGEVRLLYVAPERFASPRFAEAIARTRVGLFVVDEAHCISQWGHDFRPDYFFLADAARRVGARATMGLTATATPAVADDIARRLELRDPVRVTTGFDRPNLSFAVARCGTAVDKRRRLAAALGEPDALPAIVYAGTRRTSEEVAGFLTRALGEEVLAYHAGLPRAARAATQERFMSGDARVIVATNAFGMGIDKADVRTVCHATVPGSLEAYYQEAGRAGRDGAPARCLLFAEQRDKGLHVFFIQRSRLDAGVFGRVAERLRWAGLDGRYDVAVSELAADVGSAGDSAGDSVRAVIGHLVRAGLIVPQPAPPDRAAGLVVGQWDRGALARCVASSRDAERARWAQYRSVWAYVEGSGCRREALLAHFGDRSRAVPSVACCDVCSPTVASPALPASPASPALPALPGESRSGGGGDLDAAILDVVVSAAPPVGRTRAVEILRGGRSKVIVEHAYDRLSAYGAFAHMHSSEVLGRVDQLLETGTLRSTGGRFPKLRAA